MYKARYSGWMSKTVIRAKFKTSPIAKLKVNERVFFFNYSKLLNFLQGLQPKFPAIKRFNLFRETENYLETLENLIKIVTHIWY